MRIMAYRARDALVLRIESARIDAALADDFRTQARAALGDVTGRVVLDMHRVEFVDSSGIGAMVGLRKMLGDRGDLEVAALTRPVEKVFTITRMFDVFTVHERAPEAA